VTEPHAIILFDGVCNLCNGIVQFLLKRDGGYFQFTSLQSDAGKKLLRKYTGSDIPQVDSAVLIEHGKVYTRADAAVRIFRQLKLPWRLLGFANFLPRFIRDGAYDFISHRRYAWFGKQESCWLPDPAYAKRFIG